MAQLPLKLLTAMLLLQLSFAASGALAEESFQQGVSSEGNATPLLQRTDNVVTRRQLLVTLPPVLTNISSLPNITVPPSLQNLTAAQAYNLSSINQTLIVSQLRVPANLTALLGQNETSAYVNKLVGQTLPLILACSSNATGQLFVCFKTWQAVFNRSYLNATEEQYRFAVFINNTQAIVAQDAALVRFFTPANHTVNQTQIAQLFLEDQLPPQITTLLNITTLLSFNQYSDRTLAELGRRYGGALPGDPPGLPEGNATLGNGTIGARRMLLAGGSAPKGKSSWISYANPIRNQGQCGYCWVFSVTGSLEIVNNIVANSVKYAFSEEQIVDCLGARCDSGGFAQWSSWVPKNKPWATSAQDPYQEEDGTKSQCPTGSPGSWFSNLVKCNYNWNDWKKVLDVQPTLFYIFADDDFQAYSGNTIIASQCTSQQSNHLMVAVGYDTFTSSAGDVYEYIIFRNSWGTDFGINGYGKLAMTKNGKDLNLCATTSKGIVFHANPGIPLPSLSSSCQNLALTDKIQQ